jgi:hypothetical protein
VRACVRRRCSRPTQDPAARLDAATALERLRPRTVTVHVRLVSGKVVPLELEATSQVAAIKEQLATMSQGCLTPAHIRLVFGGRELQEQTTMKDYNVEDESTVQIQMRLPEATVC